MAASRLYERHGNWKGAAIYFIILSGVRLSLLVLRPLTGLLYQPRMIGDGDCGEKLVE
jgi:hypothetical protein